MGNMACSVAGITSDANVLTNELRLMGQRYHYRFRESMPCEQLVSSLCDLKQAYTQYVGKRPFGVSILKQEYKEGEMSLDGALDLSMKVLSKTLDMTKLTADKIEIATLKRNDGKTKIHILTAD